MEEKNLDKMTATELRELALKDYPNITSADAMKKEELIKSIRQARGEVVEEKKKKTVKAKVKLGKKDLKKQIYALKAEKEKLLEGKDKKGLAKIRKKIKKIKRLMKRAVEIDPDKKKAKNKG
jgi:hypothetical protein